ncbi:TPA: hypothetical protein HA231_04055 [Candidatus Woesearchaeota archaeon]|nr:hypothetical protein [Candidatus Woesearchaeota archaeon]
MAKLNNGRKAQYLTIDAFIAAMIVATTLVIVLAERASQPYTTQSELLSKGVSESLAQAKLIDLNNPLIVNLSLEGNITNLDNTVLQQATEFYLTQRKSQAFRMLQNVTQRLIDQKYSFRIIINGDLIYNRTLTSENTSVAVVSSRKIIFGVINKTALAYGPVIAEVTVWQ